MLPDWRVVNPYQALLAEALQAEGVRVRFAQGYLRGLPLSRALRPAPRPDLLHLHWPTAYLRSRHPVWRRLYMWRTLFDLWLLRQSGIPVVWTVHNLVTHDTPTPAPEMRFSARLARLADRLIVHGAAAREAVITQLRAPPEKVAVIPHGPLRDAYGDAPDKATARAALDLPPQAPVVLFFGLIRPYKGVLELLAAWSGLSEQARQGGTLLVAGNASEGPYATAVRAQAAAAPATRLDMRFIEEDEVPILMAAADLLVLPFQASLTSGTVRLAMDYGLPVVVPRTPGTAEGAGLVLTPDTGPEALGQTICRALASAPGRHAPDPAPSWSDIARSHAQVYAQARSDR